MRVDEFQVEPNACRASTLTQTDGFARLNTNSIAGPTVGGFRILGPRPLKRTGNQRRALHGPLQRSWDSTRDTRLHTASFLSVLLIGSLAFAVLAGPANCTCGYPAAATTAKTEAGARLIARFAYSKGSMADLGARVRARASAPDAQRHDNMGLPKLSTVALASSDDTWRHVVPGDSPISTAAVPSAANASQPRRFSTAEHIGLMPAGMVALPDAAPHPIRLAAVPPADNEIVPLLPSVVVSARDVPEATSAETQAKPATAPPQPFKNKSHRKQQAKQSIAKPATPRAKARRAPRWSQQMYGTNWQSKAFSYLR